MGAGGLLRERFEGVHMCTYLWCQHTSRRKGRCAERCCDSTGLVGVVVLTLRCFIILETCMRACACVCMRVTESTTSMSTRCIKTSRAKKSVKTTTIMYIKGEGIAASCGAT